MHTLTKVALGTLYVFALFHTTDLNPFLFVEPWQHLLRDAWLACPRTMGLVYLSNMIVCWGIIPQMLGVYDPV